MSDTKVCTKCNETKKLEKFSRLKAGKYGRSSQCKDCRAIYNRQWFERNPTDKEIQKARSQKYETENKEGKRAYRNSNRRKRTAYEQNRRARLASIPNEMPDNYWNLLLAFYGGVCARCGTDENLQHDHVTPITWPDCSHSLRNSQILCMTHNSSKKNYSDDDYRDWSKGILVDHYVS